ncbi:MAG: IS1634 family transposase [Candidatus Acidifodinimicrobium sp.]
MAIAEMEALPPLEFGMIYASRIIAQETGIWDVFNELMPNHADTLFMMMASRLIKPTSDLAFTEFIKRIYYPWSSTGVEKDQVYRILDELIEVKDNMEAKLYKKLNPKTSMVYYDLTSSYFEGKENNDLVVYGYSRDKKRGKKQIVVGLVMADGIPIHHEVWKGNTVDPETIKSTLTGLRERFGIKRTIFVEDRAFGRRVSLRLLDKNEYITAVYRRDQPYRDIMMSTEFDKEMEVEEGIYAKEVKVDWDTEGMGKREAKRVGKRRGIVIYNKKREITDLEDLENKVEKIKGIISSNKSKEEIMNELEGLKSYVKNRGEKIELNGKKIEIMKKIAGKYMLVTNTELGVKEIVYRYKELWRIERAFRTIKSFINMRPIYHRREDRIRAHVMVSVLSLLMGRIMEKRMEEKMTADKISEILSGVKAIPIKSKDKVITITSMSEESKEVMNKLGVVRPNNILQEI